MDPGTYELMKDVASKATSVKVRNVLNPMLWLSAIVLPIGLLFAYATRSVPWMSAPILWMTILVPAASVLSYFYFMLKDPQRLQSEEFVLAQHRMLIQEKGSNYPVDINTLPSLDDPEMRRLDSDLNHG